MRVHGRTSFCPTRGVAITGTVPSGLPAFEFPNVGSMTSESSSRAPSRSAFGCYSNRSRWPSDRFSVGVHGRRKPGLVAIGLASNSRSRVPRCLGRAESNRGRGPRHRSRPGTAAKRTRRGGVSTFRLPHEAADRAGGRPATLHHSSARGLGGRRGGRGVFVSDRAAARRRWRSTRAMAAPGCARPLSTQLFELPEVAGSFAARSCPSRSRRADRRAPRRPCRGPSKSRVPSG